MTFHQFGDEQKPHIMLIHGDGNAWWNYLRQAKALAKHYHVILPNLDGHGEDWEIPYVSTEATADKLLAYIDEHCGGRLFALGGVSLGGQIVLELLSRRSDVAEKAIVDGSLCIPQSFMAKYCAFTTHFAGKKLYSEKACRKQLDTMKKLMPERMHFPREIEDYYMADMPLTPGETLRTIYRTYMGSYQLKDSIKETTAQLQLWCAERDMDAVKKSAMLVQSMVPSCTLRLAKGRHHGYVALYLPDEWLDMAKPFLKES